MSDSGPAELELEVGAAANGGSCVARHEGRVVFVRYALPGERVRARVTAQRGSFWHADAVEVLDASPDRIEPLCPVAGVDGAGCCDLAFADPHAARVLKGAVVANQLARLGDFAWDGAAGPVGSGEATGWRTRVQLDVDEDGRAGLHRYHSDDLVTDLRCGQLPAGMVDGLEGPRWRPGDRLHVVLDDDGRRHVRTSSADKRGFTVVEGDPKTVQRVGERVWRLPVTAFWQSHRDAAAQYSALVERWLDGSGGGGSRPRLAWDLYGGAGLFAAALAGVVGDGGRVITVDTARGASVAAKQALAGLPVRVVSDSVRRFLSGQTRGADVAVLDPPRAGAGREVVGLVARAGVGQVIHIGCEAAAFARDIGLYRSHGYRVDELRVFDAFPLTHHVECFALLSR